MGSQRTARCSAARSGQGPERAMQRPSHRREHLPSTSRRRTGAIAGSHRGPRRSPRRSASSGRCVGRQRGLRGACVAPAGRRDDGSRVTGRIRVDRRRRRRARRQQPCVRRASERMLPYEARSRMATIVGHDAERGVRARARPSVRGLFKRFLDVTLGSAAFVVAVAGAGLGMRRRQARDPRPGAVQAGPSGPGRALLHDARSCAR